MPFVQNFSFKCLSTDCNQIIRDGKWRYFRQFAEWLRKVAYLPSFAFNLVDLVGVKETEILHDNDMSVNFKDFAVETRFVVAICSGVCATFSKRTTSWLFVV